jgi:hypothetical protein
MLTIYWWVHGGGGMNGVDLSICNSCSGKVILLLLLLNKSNNNFCRSFTFCKNIKFLQIFFDATMSIFAKNYQFLAKISTFATIL